MDKEKKLLYTKDHEWVDPVNGEAKIGITNFAQGQLGDIIFIEFPNLGSKFSAGDVFGEIEAVKTVSELYMPISGVIKQVNIDLEDSPDFVNSDPYGDGWIIKIEPTKIEEKLNLMDFEQYHKLLE